MPNRIVKNEPPHENEYFPSFIGFPVAFILGKQSHDDDWRCKATDLSSLVQEFAEQVSLDHIEVYNEASIQYELAIFLRRELPRNYKVQLERNIDYFGLDKGEFLKREMDIVVSCSSNGEKHCVELKFPTNGQYPEQMFSACKDIKFLEQLVSAGFGESFFVMFADDPLFYTNKGDSGIYLSFRKEKLIKGSIQKPTGEKDETLHFSGTYAIQWKEVANGLKYFVVRVDSASLKL